jgi:hypothetical protein
MLVLFAGLVSAAVLACGGEGEDHAVDRATVGGGAGAGGSGGAAANAASAGSGGVTGGIGGIDGGGSDVGGAGGTGGTGGSTSPGPPEIASRQEARQSNGHRASDVCCSAVRSARRPARDCGGEFGPKGIGRAPCAPRNTLISLQIINLREFPI